MGAASATPPDSWAHQVALFLLGKTPPTAFLKRANGRGEETEARAYIGLMASLSGQRATALEHLRWVKSQGAKNYTEYGLARDELRRLEAAPAPPAP